MLACVSPDAADAPETLCTLQVAGPHRSALAVVA